MIDERHVWENKLIVINCYKFHKFVMGYCEKNGIQNSFEAFLWFKFNGIISSTYRFLYKAPLHYVSNSKAFRRFYNTIDLDFRKDIMTIDEMTNIQKYIQQSVPLVRALKRIMKEDALYVYKDDR